MKGWMGRFRALMLFSGIALLLSGCGNPYVSALQPKGEGSEMIFDLMMISIAVMVLVFVVVMLIYTFVFVRFRQKKGQEDYIPKQTEGNHMLETLWTVIPIILLLILAVPTVQYSFALDDTKPKTAEGEVVEDALWIDVTGKQFWWNFDYRGLDIQTSQDLYIPTDKRVYLTLSSGDVIHSFWVPTLSGKIDVNPGKNVNEMWINALEEGQYWGHCAELCGTGHSLMEFQVIAVSPGEFDQWVEEMQGINREQVPADPIAAEGQQLFNQSCLSCHAIGSSPNVGFGPNLSNFGDRTKVAGILEYDNPEEFKANIVDWILNNKDLKPGNKMWGMYNMPSKDEAEKIAAYLMTLKPSEINPEDAKDGEYVKSEPKEEVEDVEEDDNSDVEEDNSEADEENTEQ